MVGWDWVLVRSTVHYLVGAGLVPALPYSPRRCEAQEAPKQSRWGPVVVS